MTSLLQELKRRNVFRVALAYVVVGWVVLQVAEFLSPLLQLPGWTVSLALYIGIIGFPFALLFAWAFELTPQGLRLTEHVSPDQSITNHTGRALNRTIIGLMGVAILLLLAERFYSIDVNGGADEPAVVVETSSVPQAGMSRDSATEPESKSIAVLPFVNMSKDPDQEYFSDGISEELLNGLAKIRDLRVAARTSSFAFKGQNSDITEIGKQLKVGTVLEGSVRKAGQRVRITAQLINVTDGYHLWSETYDRELIDIFAIQDEISAAIINALKVHLSAEEAATVEREAIDLDAYNFYLLARHSLRRRTTQSLELAVKQYQKAIDIDPTYAAAWAGKAAATELLSEIHYGNAPIESSRRQAQDMLNKAFSFDQDLAEAHATQGLLHMNHGEPQAALEHLDRAIQGNPSEGILYAWRSICLDQLGRHNESNQALEQAFTVDPLHQTIRHNLAVTEAFEGNYALARELVTPDSELAYEVDSVIASREGRFADASLAIIEAMARTEGGYDIRGGSTAAITYFFTLANTEKAREHAIGTFQLLIDTFSVPELAYQKLNSIPASERSLFAEDLLATSLIRLQRCPEMLALYQDFNPLTAPVWGDLGGGYSNVDRMAAYGW